MDIEEEIDLTLVSAIASLMFSEVLLQLSNTVIFISNLLADQLLNSFVLLLIIGGQDAEDVLKIGCAFVQ